MLMEALARETKRRLEKMGLALTLGGEPTYVPVNPEGLEWSVSAVGPTKLGYAQAMAAELMRTALPQAVSFFSPGKLYPGEADPRWALHLVWKRDGTSLAGQRAVENPHAPTAPRLAKFRHELLRRLKLSTGWIKAQDPLGHVVYVLPIDHPGTRWKTVTWPKTPRIFPLFPTEAPAGLRLPLHLFPEGASKRALVVEARGHQLHFFLPPLLQEAFLVLLAAVQESLRLAGLAATQLQGYLPEDERKLWSTLTLAADPGVLEVNIPPCAAWAEYHHWLSVLETAAHATGLRSWKQTPAGAAGTGGGNHLLFGGPTLEETPLFSRPLLVTSILRYWQRHPSLSYLFTGNYVGPSSQAPRPDESARSLYDLEMAYRFLEELPAGDHRYLISETLRHLHTDSSGNTHRSEISFDKFWNASWPGGCRGLVEFRAVETMPRAEWMSAVGLLWLTLATWLARHPYRRPLVEHGQHLHDRYFLPSYLWADFVEIAADLQKAGLELPLESFRAILDWRFPVLLTHEAAGGNMQIRRAHEGWPLLCETPLEGGSTSRFVDTSMERVEITMPLAWQKTHTVYVQGRRLELTRFNSTTAICGLRFRRTALYPSLHPGILPQMPLIVSIHQRGRQAAYALQHDAQTFVATTTVPPRARAGRKLDPGLLTYDLRIG